MSSPKQSSTSYQNSKSNQNNTVDDSLAQSPAVITFDLSGSIFRVALSTLQKHPESMLYKMVEEGKWKEGSASSSKRSKIDLSASHPIFIDRCGRVFPFVLQYLRDGKILLPFNVSEREVKRELKFFGLEEDVEIEREASWADPQYIFNMIKHLKNELDDGIRHIRMKLEPSLKESLDLTCEYLALKIYKKVVQESTGVRYLELLVFPIIRDYIWTPEKTETMPKEFEESVLIKSVYYGGKRYSAWLSIKKGDLIESLKSKGAKYHIEITGNDLGILFATVMSK